VRTTVTQAIASAMPNRTRHTKVFPDEVAIAGDRMVVGAEVSTEGMFGSKGFANGCAECRPR
jgi:hypothetical protein